MRNQLFACFSEETTSSPYVVPWYEEYDYADRTSSVSTTSHQYVHRYLAVAATRRTLTDASLHSGIEETGGGGGESAEGKGRKRSFTLHFVDIVRMNPPL